MGTPRRARGKQAQTRGGGIAGMIRTLFSPKPSPVLARGRLTVIKDFQRTDVDRWIAWPRHSDPLFEAYNPPILTTRQRDSYYSQRRAATDQRQYAVEDLCGDFVGRISLRDIDWHARTAVLGISFHPGRLGHGLGTDGLHAFLDYYFSTLDMHAMFLDVAAHNKRAQRCYEKLGFRYLGQRWGDAQPDYAGVFRYPQLEDLRPYFRREAGLVRPLLYDMVLRQEAYFGAREAADIASSADTP